MKKNLLKETIINALGIVTLASTSMVSATVINYDWNGLFTFLDPTGAALSNSSLNNGSTGNNFQDTVSGTLVFDDITGAGIATMSSFGWGNGLEPLAVNSFNLQTIGDGAGGPGMLIMGNMLFNWNTNTGIPVSMVLDASGFLSGELTSGGPMGAVPASDGTWIDTTWGYLNTGPVPMATTSWNTTNHSNCVESNCTGNGTSGMLPFIADTAINTNDFDLTTPTYSDLANDGVGGSPIQNGVFPGFNFNIDFTALTITNPDAGGSITAFDVAPEVPVPAAVWLFSSGMLGLIGVARRKRSEVKDFL